MQIEDIVVISDDDDSVNANDAGSLHGQQPINPYAIRTLNVHPLKAQVQFCTLPPSIGKTQTTISFLQSVGVSRPNMRAVVGSISLQHSMIFQSIAQKMQGPGAIVHHDSFVGRPQSCCNDEVNRKVCWSKARVDDHDDMTWQHF